MKRIYLYILKCKDNSFYTGITASFKKRISEHKLGQVSFTKSRLPIKLLYLESFNNIKLAAKREKEIKGWRREKKIKLINSLRRR